MESRSDVSDSPEKIVRLAEFAPALSLAFLALCLTITKGFLPLHGGSAFAMGLLTASLLSCLAALLFPDAKLPRFQGIPILQIVAREPVLALLAACLAFQCQVLCNWYFSALPIFGVVPIFIVLAVWSARETKKLSPKIIFFVLFGTAILFVVCNPAVWRAFPATLEDVAVFQRDSSYALARGHNPYTLTFPDIYGQASSLLYGPGASVDGLLQFGYPYLPLTLLWVLPAQIVLGDFRYASILALVIAAACILALRRNPVVAASAMLLLFSVPTFFVVQHSWTEPLPVMLLCVVAWAARYKKASSFLTIGVLVAAKQYLVLLFPLLILLPEEKTKTQRIFDVLKAVAVTTFITLPFVLWNPRAFFHSTLFIQIAQPFRDESLSYLAFLKLITGTQPPAWPGFIMAMIAIAFCLWRAPRTATGFTLSVALVMFGFIAFARQAFINYYFLIFGALCCATALANSESEEEPLKSPAVEAAR
jgi:uncharacterized membrane protein